MAFEVCQAKCENPILQTSLLAIFVDNFALNTIFNSDPDIAYSPPHRAVECQQHAEDAI
jgi:hypothetical protein